MASSSAIRMVEVMRMLTLRQEAILLWGGMLFEQGKCPINFRPNCGEDVTFLMGRLIGAPGGPI